MVLHKSFFSDPTVRQILGELMDVRRDCRSWLGVTYAHHHDSTGKAQPIRSFPKETVSVHDARWGTTQCFSREGLDSSSLYEVSWTCVDGQVRVVTYSTANICKGNPVEHSLLERYLPRLQGYGDGVEMFVFNKNVPLQGKLLFESQHDFGVLTQSVCAEQVKDGVPRGWYDRDFKVVIRYSQELVSI